MRSCPRTGTETWFASGRCTAEAGIPHYWLCDLRQDTLTLLELQDGAYAERAALTAEDTLTTPLLPGFAIPLADIFRHPLRPPHAGE